MTGLDNASPVLVAVLLVLGLAHVCGVLLVAHDLYCGNSRPAPVDPLLCFGIAGGIAGALGFAAVAALVTAGVGILASWLAARRFVDYRPAGIVVWGTLLLLTVAGVGVGVEHLAGLDVAPATLASLWTVTVLGVLRTPSSLLHTFENWEVALRQRWRRPTTPITDRPPSPDAPFVTVVVPTYAEPPDVVIGTLDALSQLGYPHFEVLVVDNNTADERLWHPVRTHCERLGSRFRFLHVEGISGAKAGALNWSRAHLDPRTELVALVDADYQVDPRWLAHSVPYFDDPVCGYVQCPQAYRDFEHSVYGRMANAAYQDGLYTEMVSRHEQGAGISLGTMSVLRLRTIDDAGGWAEWCVTEDSEFAIRAHAAGYSSVWLTTPYGWGLIPETFAELKKQRRRWTIGPGQELQAHFRLYLPGRLRVPSRLTDGQRRRHMHYGLVVLTIGLGVASLPISAALLISMVAHQESPTVTIAALIPLGAVLIGRRVMRWVIYRRIVGIGRWETLGGMIAMLALRPTIAQAAFDILVGRKALWKRTDKFPQRPSRYRAIQSTRRELLVATACLAATMVTPLVMPATLATMLIALGFGWQTLVFASAPVLALLAERDLKRLSSRPPSLDTPVNLRPGSARDISVEPTVSLPRRSAG